MSAKAAMMRLPTLWSERSPPPSKRSLKTSASFLRPARATRQFLTSPGGATPSSCLKRPLDPPSSATVTTAVRSPTLSRRPRKSTGNPVPPPNATTRNSVLLPVIGVQYTLARPGPAVPATPAWTRRRITAGTLGSTHDQNRLALLRCGGSPVTTFDPGLARARSPGPSRNYSGIECVMFAGFDLPDLIANTDLDRLIEAVGLGSHRQLATFERYLQRRPTKPHGER